LLLILYLFSLGSAEYLDILCKVERFPTAATESTYFLPILTYPTVQGKKDLKRDKRPG